MTWTGGVLVVIVVWYVIATLSRIDGNVAKIEEHLATHLDAIRDATQDTAQHTSETHHEVYRLRKGPPVEWPDDSA